MLEKNFIITNDNVDKYVKKITKWIKDKVEQANADGVVLGMSGGVDCSTVAILCQKAKVNIDLILMPYGDNPNSNKKAKELINKFNFKYHIFDIKPAVDAVLIPTKNITEKVKLARANIRPRIRMTYLYEYAQINNLLVIGTGNLSEITIGYFTKWGDGAYDLNPLASLSKSEVYILANYLKVPETIINAKPSADLWEGQTDEDEIGISYEQIDNYILKGTSGNRTVDDIIKQKEEKNRHKIKSAAKFGILEDKYNKLL